MNKRVSPYIPPKSKLTMAESKNCPICDEKFTLSWGNYLKHPFGGYRCTKCNAKLKLQHTLFYRAWFVLWLGIYFAGFLLIQVKLKGYESQGVFVFLWLVLMSILFIPIDKKIKLTLNVLS